MHLMARKPVGGRAGGAPQQRGVDWPAGGGAARARDARDNIKSGGAGGWDSALPAFPEPKLERAPLPWQDVQLRPVRCPRSAATS